MNPRVSIIIPCYNHGQYIREALDSVEKVSDKSLYEVIIVNDGSKDAYTIEMMDKLAAEGYHVVNQVNQGLGKTRNNGIKIAKGDYILPLDADNRIRPEYIYKSIEILDAHPEIAMVYGDAQFFGDKDKRHVVGEFNLQNMMIENQIDACAVYRKSAWEVVGGYDEKMPIMGYEDWDMWMNMTFKNYKFHYIPEILFDYRVLGNSMLRSISITNKKKLYRYMDEKYKSYLNMDIMNQELMKLCKRNKKVALKLVFAVYFPGLLKFLVKRNIIKDPDIF
ncbi:MAG: glycosyltransferase family 2 protein [Ferruginibacter sp.]|nr:glycosyltransferase family 2 protein [Ferruginibacter sp.]